MKTIQHNESVRVTTAFTLHAELSDATQCCEKYDITFGARSL